MFVRSVRFGQSAGWSQGCTNSAMKLELMYAAQQRAHSLEMAQHRPLAAQLTQCEHGSGKLAVLVAHTRMHLVSMCGNNPVSLAAACPVQMSRLRSAGPLFVPPRFVELVKCNFRCSLSSTVCPPDCSTPGQRSACLPHRGTTQSQSSLNMWPTTITKTNQADVDCNFWATTRR